jgi:hypothetical protein
MRVKIVPLSTQVKRSLIRRRFHPFGRIDLQISTNLSGSSGENRMRFMNPDFLLMAT